MLIRKINSVFMRHSRWLFGVFTVVIIVSFLGFLTPGQFGVGGCGDAMSMRVGTAFGNAVTYSDLRSTMQEFSVASALLYNQRGDVKPEQAFYLYCMQQAAARRGITATDDEIAELVQTLPIFQKDGKFDYARYQSEVDTLRRQGIDGDLLAAALRSVIVVNKLNQEMMASVVVTPGEVEVFYRQVNEKYRIKLAEFNAAAYTSKVKADPRELKKFFDANRADYVVRQQLTAEVAVFPFDDPAALKEAAAVDEATVARFYEENKASFADKKSGETPAYDKIKDQVKAQCVAARVRAAVTRAAQEFAREAYDAVGEARDKAAAFAQLVDGRKLKRVATGKFAADAAAAGPIAEAELVAQLAAVFDGAPVTNAVAGKLAAYVGMVTAREAERPAEFNEVSARVMEDYLRGEGLKLARAAAAEAAARLAALPVAKRFAAPEWKQSLEFSLMDPPMTAVGPQAVGAVNDLAVGAVSAPLPTADGALVVGLVGRTPADMAGFAKARERFDLFWRQAKMAAQSADFQQYLQTNCSYEMEQPK